MLPLCQRSRWAMSRSGIKRFRTGWTGVLVLLASSVAASDWPAFRGPAGYGVSQEEKASLHCGPGKNVRWKAALSGPGNSSPIVSSGRVFVTCAESEGRKRNLHCFDRRTGQQLWVRTVEFPAVEPTHRLNPYCASTPVADGSNVSLGAFGVQEASHSADDDHVRSRFAHPIND